MLAAKNGSVILACRDRSKADRAAALIRESTPGATLHLLTLDLSSLTSVRQFTREVTEHHPRVDVLINNAGVMALPYGKTVDGFELQLGTNHLGPFALTALLLPALERAAAPRVVSVSSTMHRSGTLDLDDLQAEKSYSRWPTYGTTKLANLLFTYELERRLRAGQKKAIAVACHPGYANTNLLMAGHSPLVAGFLRLSNRLIAQSAEQGAWPTLFAATDSSVKGGDFIGPDGLFELAGAPKVVRSSKKSQDRALAQALWAISERLTHTEFGLTEAR